MKVTSRETLFSLKVFQKPLFREYTVALLKAAMSEGLVLPCVAPRRVRCIPRSVCLFVWTGDRSLDNQRGWLSVVNVLMGRCKVKTRTHKNKTQKTSTNP